MRLPAVEMRKPMHNDRSIAKNSRLLSTQRPMRRRSRARLLAGGSRCLGLLPALRRLQQLEVGRCARLLREDVVLQSTQRKGERLQPAHLYRHSRAPALLASCPTCCKCVQRKPHNPRPTRSRDALLHNGLAEGGTKLAQLPQASRQASTDAQARNAFVKVKSRQQGAPGTPPCRRPFRPR